MELVAPNGLDRNVPGLELTKIFAEFFITKFLNAFSIVCIPEKQEEVAGVVKHCLRDNQLQELSAKISVSARVVKFFLQKIEISPPKIEICPDLTRFLPQNRDLSCFDSICPD